MNVEEIVEIACQEARAILAARGRSGFFGTVTTKYESDKLVHAKIEESISLK